MVLIKDIESIKKFSLVYDPPYEVKEGFITKLTVQVNYRGEIVELDGKPVIKVGVHSVGYRKTNNGRMDKKLGDIFRIVTDTEEQALRLVIEGLVKSNDPSLLAIRMAFIQFLEDLKED